MAKYQQLILISFLWLCILSSAYQHKNALIGLSFCILNLLSESYGQHSRQTDLSKIDVDMNPIEHENLSTSSSTTSSPTFHPSESPRNTISCIKRALVGKPSSVKSSSDKVTEASESCTTNIRLDLKSYQPVQYQHQARRQTKSTGKKSFVVQHHWNSPFDDTIEISLDYTIGGFVKVKPIFSEFSYFNNRIGATLGISPTF